MCVCGRDAYLIYTLITQRRECESVAEPEGGEAPARALALAPPGPESGPEAGPERPVRLYHLHG